MPEQDCSPVADRLFVQCITFFFLDKLPVLIDPQACMQPISLTHLRWDGKTFKTVKVVAAQPQVLFQKEFFSFFSQKKDFYA